MTDPPIVVDVPKGEPSRSNRHSTRAVIFAVVSCCASAVLSSSRAVAQQAPSGAVAPASASVLLATTPPAPTPPQTSDLEASRAADRRAGDFVRILHETAQDERSQRFWFAGAGLVGAAALGGAGAAYVAEGDSNARKYGWSLVGIGLVLPSETERIDRDVHRLVSASGELTPAQQAAMQERWSEASTHWATRRTLVGWGSMFTGVTFGGLAIGLVASAHDGKDFSPLPGILGILSPLFLTHGATMLWMRSPAEAGYSRWRTVAAPQPSVRIRVVPMMAGIGVVGAF